MIRSFLTPLDLVPERFGLTCFSHLRLTCPYNISMEKFRVRLKTGRVVGPFLADQVLEMRERQIVSGLEDCQVYPAGDWIKLEDFHFWNNKNQTKKEDATFVIDLTQLQKKKQETIKTSHVAAGEPENVIESPSMPAEVVESPKQSKTQFREFDYKNIADDTDEISPPPRPKSFTNKKNEASSEKEITKHQPAEEEFERTVVKSAGAIKQEDEFERTVVKTEAIKWKKEQEIEKSKKDEVKQKIENEKKLHEEEEKKNTFDLDIDSTQAISLASLKSELHEEAVRTEHELIQIEEIVQSSKKKKKETIDKAAQAEQESSDEEEERLKQKEKKKKIILFLAVLFVLAILFPEDEKKEKKEAVFVPLEPTIEFPVPFDVRDDVKHKSFLAVAQEKAASGKYFDKVDAAKAYRLAYENNSSDKKSLTRMIRIYSELLPHSLSFERDGGIVFKMLQANRVLQDVDADISLAAGLFYRAIDKKDAGFEVMDRFVKSGSNNPTRELFAELLNSLIDQNNEAKADEVATSLLKTTNRGIEVNLSLINYYRYKNYPEKAKGVVEESLREKPDSVPLLIAKGEFLVEEAKINELAEVYKKINGLNSERSKLYYGKLLEFKGFILAYQNKPAEAAVAFNQSLTFNDSDTLRDKLTNINNIDPNANDEASKLIKQVKARVLTKEAGEDLKNYNFESALLKSLEAYGLKSGYLKADLALANLQLRLGMAQDALNTLEDLYKKYPADKNVSFTLLKAYISNYKFNDAKRMIAIMAAGELREDWRYSSLNATMYEKMGDLNQSILWLQKAINQNPLEDENLYSLAKLFLKAKRLGQAKNNLFKAMELNPSFIEYKLAYAAIIYETDGPDKAVDYLFGLRSQYPNDPAILGEIAIYYYRAGKNQQFLDTKSDIEKLPRRDPRVYRFLAKAALLDEKYDDAVKFTEELLKLEPGDLNAMMETGKMLMALKRYKEAAGWFVKVRDKLPTYPRVGFYKAKIELYVKNPEQALLDVREDMKMNGEYEEGLNLAGDILFDAGEYAAAEAEYKKALRLSTRSYGALRGLADVAAKKGQLDIAFDLYKRAMSDMKDAQEPSIHRKMGDVLRLTGQGRLAIESYQMYLKLDENAPDRSQVEEYIRILE